MALAPATTSPAARPVRAVPRREVIRAQAAKLFAERGFHGVTIEDIGAAAGVTGPAIYRHFPSKDALLADLLVDISNHLHTGGGVEVAAADDARDALERLVRFHLAFSLRRPELIQVQDRDLANLPPAANKQVRRLQRAYLQLWVDCLTQVLPGCDEREARARVHAGFGLLNSTPHSAVGLDGDAMEALLGSMAIAALTSR